MEDLISKIKSSATLSPKAEEYVVSIAKEKAVSKGDVLIRQGQAATVSLDSNFSLLGTGFLLKFSNVKWDMKEETLTIFK